MPTMYVKADRAEVTRIMREFVRAFAGKTGSYGGLVQGLQLRLAEVLLSLIRQDFETKSRGGTGVDGITWKPLSAKYLAYGRRFAKGEAAKLIRGIGAKNKGGRRPLLDAGQDKAWRQTFARTKASLESRGLDEQEASRRAAAIAWAKVKQMGGKTKLVAFAGRQADILRDTGELFRSLASGISDGRVIRINPGQVIVGTNKKPWHHRGTRTLPPRPYWPRDGKFPDEYWAPIIREARRGVLEAVMTIMAGRAA